MLTIGIPKETIKGETRVALSPTISKQLTNKGFKIYLEPNAGEHCCFSDNDYIESGAEIIDLNKIYQCDLIVKINPPNKDEISMMKKGITLISLLFAHSNISTVTMLAEKQINVLSLDSIPRTSLAQSMDVLSSQANLAGYKSVILGGVEMGKIFPMLMTSAGTIKPALVVIFGAGVAGLQAIATAKRLGANVWVSDIRPETKEQVASLGGKFIEVGELENVATEGGYVKEVSEDFLIKQKEAVLEKVIEADLVITTALVPGKKAPLLISEDMVSKMKAGSVIVDMAVSQGGNCELSELNKVVNKHNIKIVGEGNLPATLPINASELFAKNIQNFVQHLTEEGKFKWDLEDEITAGSLILKNGDVFQESLKEIIQAEPA
jgi:NAD(P) transhydrogenase subunit alpha